LLDDVKESHQRAIVGFVHGLSVEVLSRPELQPIRTLVEVRKLATMVDQIAKVRNNHYTLSYNSGTS
jgi:hypothetical protein